MTEVYFTSGKNEIKELPLSQTRKIKIACTKSKGQMPTSARFSGKLSLFSGSMQASPLICDNNLSLLRDRSIFSFQITLLHKSSPSPFPSAWIHRGPDLPFAATR